jgi:hypothetical protein
LQNNYNTIWRGIDMPAGPSELLIVADDTVVPASIRFIIASRTWSRQSGYFSFNLKTN